MNGDQHGGRDWRHGTGAGRERGQADCRVRRSPANLHVVVAGVFAREVDVENEVAQGTTVFVGDADGAG